MLTARADSFDPAAMEANEEPGLEATVEQEAPVEQVQAVEQNVQVEAGAELELSIQSGKALNELTWESSDENIVHVTKVDREDGTSVMVISGTNAGNAQIKASQSDGQVVEIWNVVVTEAPAEQNGAETQEDYYAEDAVNEQQTEEAPAENNEETQTDAVSEEIPEETLKEEAAAPEEEKAETEEAPAEEVKESEETTAEEEVKSEETTAEEEVKSEETTAEEEVKSEETTSEEVPAEIEEESKEETSEEAKSEEEKDTLSYDEAIEKLYNETMTISDEEILEVAEKMEDDLEELEKAAEKAENVDDAAGVVDAVKEFEVAKSEYLAEGTTETEFNSNVESELEKQKNYLDSYVVSEGSTTQTIPKISVESTEISGDTATVNATEWVTAGYDNAEGSTSASAFEYAFTLTLSKDEESGEWAVSDISNTDQNFDWMITSEEFDRRLASVGITKDSTGGYTGDTASVGSYNSQGVALDEYMAPGDGTYRPSDAIAYADTWWNGANPAYTSYVSLGVDCANFVSQSLYAGGMAKTSTWYPNSYAWVNVNGQIAFLRNYGTFTSATSSSVYPGNPVYYDWDSSGDYDHTGICVGYSGGVPIVDAHTSARYHVHYAMGCSSVATIQLSTSTNAGSSSGTGSSTGSGTSTGSGSSTSTETKQNGWVKSGSYWYYYKNGSKQTGWLKEGNKNYYLSIASGDGHMITDWATIDGKRYYFGTSGVMRTGWAKINGSWYYFNSQGVMQTGWQTLSWSGGQSEFYFGSNGEMAVNTTVDGYSVDSNGAKITSATNGWKKSGGKWYYYENGSKVTGWKKVSGRWYYMDKNDGHMYVDWVNIDGKKYYFYSTGAMATFWGKIGGSWYYFNGDGAMRTGWQYIKWSGGKDHFYFYSNGKMAVSTYVDNYYVNADGKWVY